MLKIIKFYPNYNFIISATDSFSSDYYNKLTEGYDVTHVFNRSYDLLSVSQASLVTSGTATLETALMNIPQVVCYKTSFLSYIIAKSLVNIPYVSLINILLNRKVVDELIQSKLTVKNIKESLDKLLDRDQLKPLFSDYDNLRNLLASKNVSGKIAANILETIYL
jgi:lipid-A-disaccharide synthase